MISKRKAQVVYDIFDKIEMPTGEEPINFLQARKPVPRAYQTQDSSKLIANLGPEQAEFLTQLISEELGVAYRLNSIQSIYGIVQPRIYHSYDPSSPKWKRRDPQIREKIIDAYFAEMVQKKNAFRQSLSKHPIQHHEVIAIRNESSENNPRNITIEALPDPEVVDVKGYLFYSGKNRPPIKNDPTFAQSGITLTEIPRSILPKITFADILKHTRLLVGGFESESLAKDGVSIEKQLVCEDDEYVNVFSHYSNGILKIQANTPPVDGPVIFSITKEPPTGGIRLSLSRLKA